MKKKVSKFTSKLLMAVLTAIGFISLIQCTDSNKDIYCVRDFGAKGDGLQLDKNAINKAIQKCVSHGGGTVFFPAGNYLTGTLKLSDNVTLELSSGAIITGSSNLADYDSLKTKGYTGRALIIAKHVKNTGITGHGIINGQGSSFMDFTRIHPYDSLNQFHSDVIDGPVFPKERPHNLMVFDSCENVFLEGIKIIDSPTWTIHLACCNNVQITGIDIDNPLNIANNDGIHMRSCSNIFISDCDIKSGDDCIALSGVDYTDRLCEKILVTGCTFVSRSSAIRIGPANIRNCVFSNCVINSSNRGIGIWVKNNSVLENIIISDFIIETKLFTGIWWGQGEPIYIRSYSNKTGFAKNFMFSNIKINSEHGIIIYGAKQDIRDFTFNHIYMKLVNSSKGHLAGGYFDLIPMYEEKPAYFKHDIPALYAQYVKNLKIDDFKVEWADTVPEYFSNAIQCNNFINLEIKGFYGRQANDKTDIPAISLSDGNGVSVFNSTAAEGCRLFLDLSNVTRQKYFVNNDISNAVKFYKADKYSFMTNSNILPH